MLIIKVEGLSILHRRLLRAILTSLRKYDNDGKQLKKWDDEDIDGKRKEKQEASELFKGYWRRCTSHEKYLSLKAEWQKEKKKYDRS